MYGGGAGTEAAAGAGGARKMPVISDLKYKFGSGKMRFCLSNVGDDIANTLRRVMIAEVPTLAIDYVTIEENTTALHDEFVAHRLGLLPIKFVQQSPHRDIFETFNMHHDCDCAAGFCDRCAVVFNIDVTHDADTGTRIVTSADIVLARDRPDVEIAHFASADEVRLVKAVEPQLDHGITIVKIGPHQTLRATCIATLGIGKMHAKHSPVGTAVFRYEHDIRINADALELLTEEERIAFVKAAQVNILEYDDKSGMVRPTEKASRKLNNIDELIDVGQSHAKGDDNLVSVSVIPEKYWFHVETTGSYEPHEIVETAFTVIQRKLDNIIDGVRTATAEGAAGGAGGGEGPPDTAGGASTGQMSGGSPGMMGGGAYDLGGAMPGGKYQ